MINNWLNDGEKIPSLGGERSKCFMLDLEDLIDDECDQIVLSQQLFKAFAASSKNMKNFDKDKMYMFFKHVVYLYNDTLQKSDKYGALTYLNKITKLLDCLSIHSIMELSIEQLNLLLDLNDKDEIISTYKRIEINRHELTQAEFELFEDMLKNTSVGKIRTKESKKVYNYISAIYNTNPILQDNVNYIDYLESFSKINTRTILSLRMYDILELFKIHNINYENVNEEKKLINDLTEENFGVNTLY